MWTGIKQCKGIDNVGLVLAYRLAPKRGIRCVPQPLIVCMNTVGLSVGGKHLEKDKKSANVVIVANGHPNGVIPVMKEEVARARLG